MAKGITVSALRHVSPSAISAVAGNAGDAYRHFDSAFETFATKVAKPIDTPATWSGGGQPDAASVIRINRTAIGVSALEMQATQRTLEAFATAMATARKRMSSILEDAKEKLVIVHENGSAEVDLHAMPGPSASADAKRIAREAKGTLLFAALADKCCTELLDRINGHTPQYSNTADPKIQAGNENLLDDAYEDCDLASADLYFWQHARPKALPDDSGALARYFGDWATYLWHNPGDVGLLLRDGLMMVVGAGMVIGGAAGDVGAVSIGLTGVGLLVAIPAAAMNTAVVIGGAALAAGGAGLMGNDLSRMDKSAHNGGGDAAPRYRPGDNPRRSRTYANSTDEAKGQANNYANRMRRRGYKAVVPPVRYEKYGRSDVTVSVYRRGRLVHIRHFICRG